LFDYIKFILPKFQTGPVLIIYATEGPNKKTWETPKFTIKCFSHRKARAAVEGTWWQMCQYFVDEAKYL